MTKSGHVIPYEEMTGKKPAPKSLEARLMEAQGAKLSQLLGEVNYNNV